MSICSIVCMVIRSIHCFCGMVTHYRFQSVPLSIQALLSSFVLMVQLCKLITPKTPRACSQTSHCAVFCTVAQWHSWHFYLPITRISSWDNLWFRSRCYQPQNWIWASWSLRVKIRIDDWLNVVHGNPRCRKSLFLIISAFLPLK